MNNIKIALISGVGGQDGSYLSEYLLSLGYIVHGVVRNSMTNPNSNLEKALKHNNFKMIVGDLTEPSFVDSLDYSKYDEVYHLAAQSHVGMSFKIPDQTWKINYGTTVRMLDRYFSVKPDGKFYFAGTSELFGAQPGPQNEETPFIPVSPYAEAKLKSMEACKIFRDGGKFVTSGVLFNHESSRRGKEFVTQKIIQSVLEYKKDSKNNILVLGNLDAKRDWGYAKDYVKAMHLMLQQQNPDIFVLATNKTYTIKDFIDITCKEAGIQNYKIIENVKELNIDYKDIENIESIESDKETFYIVQSKDFFRPNEVHFLQGDYSKAERIMGWKPETDLHSLIRIMLGLQDE